MFTATAVHVLLTFLHWFHGMGILFVFGLVSTARSTNEAITDTSLIRDVPDEVLNLTPDITPLLVMSNKAQRKRPTKSPRIEKLEDDIRSVWSTNNGAALAAGATGIPVPDSTLFAVGDLVSVLRGNSTGGVEEVVRVTVVASTLTVVRGIGGFSDTISATNALRIVGSSYAEGAALGTFRSTAKTTIISYTQIFREPFSLTNTQRASDTYGGPEEDYQDGEALKNIKRQIEGAGLWGRASESLASPASIRTTQGFKSRVTTNVKDVSTTLTLKIMNNFSSDAFRYGADTKLMIAAPIYISAINFFSQSKLLTEVMQKVFGVKVMQLVLPHGTLLLARNYLMEAGISGQSGYDDEAYVIDLGAVEQRVLSNNGISRDIKAYRNVKQDGTDAIVNEYLAEIGWVFSQEKRHARMFDCSDYA